MKAHFNPIRLFAEVVVIVALAQAAVTLVLPLLGLGDAGLRSTLLGAALLALLAGPTVYWRCMAASRRLPSAAARPVAHSTGGRVRSAVAMTAAAQLLGLAATAGAVLWQQRALDDAARAQFERGVERIETEVKRRFALPLYGLYGVRGMYAGGAAINKTSFRAYVESRDLPREFPGVRGFGFIERVLRGDVEAFTAGMQAHEPHFAVRSSGAAPDLYIIKHIEPMATNHAAWGYDIGQEAVRREAAERAVRSGEPALSGRITLVQDGKQGPGFLYLVPVFRRGTDPTTPQQRQSALVGLLYVSIVAAELLGDVLAVADHTLHFALFDGDATPASQLLYDADRHLAAASGAVTTADFTGRQFESSRSFTVGGRTLALRVSTTPAFDASTDRSSLAAIGVGGALASCLMALAVWLLAVGRLRAHNRARRMTADLDLMARVVRHTSNAVVITDAALHITWVNEGFTRMTGYTLAEAQGRTPGELLGSDKTDPATIKTLQGAAAAGTACRVEVLNRSKDGRDYWVDTDVQPTRDEKGVLVGFMEIATDISQRKRDEEVVRASKTFLDRVGRVAGVGGWQVDLAAGVITWSDETCRIHEVASGHQPSLDEAIDFYAPAARPVIRAAVQAGIDEGRTWDLELPVITASGRPIWVRAVGEVEFEADRPVRLVGAVQDITARKETERVLADQRLRLANIIEGTDAGTWEWNVETNETVFNERWAEIVGYTLAELGATTGDTMKSLCHPDDSAQALKLAQQHFDEEMPYYECELRMRHKLGHWVWVLARGRLNSRAEDGRPCRMAGTHMDITERKRQEAQAQHANDILTGVIENLPCGLSVFDAEFRLVAHNAEFRRLLDLPDSLFAGTETRFEQIIRFNAERGEYGPGDVNAIMVPIIERARAPTPHQFERERPNGIAIEVRGAGMPGGGFVTTYTDISVRKRAEAEVVRAQAVLRGSIDALDDAYVLFDPDDRLVLCNQRYRDLYLREADITFAGNTFEQIIRLGAERGQVQSAIGRVDAWVAERLTIHHQANSQLLQQLADGLSVAAASDSTVNLRNMDTGKSQTRR